MRKTEITLLSIACISIGIVVGFLFAPIKKGVYCGNYNGAKFFGMPDDELAEQFDEEDFSL